VNINKAVGEQKSALGKYETDFATGMAEADRESAALLGQIQPPTMDLVTVRVMNGSTVEGEYRVPRAVAMKISEPLTRVAKTDDVEGASYDDWSPLAIEWFGSNYLNIDVTPTGTGNSYGKELHEAFGAAAAQTAESLGAATELAETEYNAAKTSIESQRGIAERRYAFEVERTNKIINETEGLWTGFIADQRKAFVDGQARNTGGIADLLKSGALQVKK
jgi:hypothetical protein